MFRRKIKKKSKKINVFGDLTSSRRGVGAYRANYLDLKARLNMKRSKRSEREKTDDGGRIDGDAASSNASFIIFQEMRTLGFWILPEIKDGVRSRARSARLEKALEYLSAKPFARLLNLLADCIREAVKTVFANALTIIEADTESEDKE